MIPKQQSLSKSALFCALLTFSLTTLPADGPNNKCGCCFVFSAIALSFLTAWYSQPATIAYCDSHTHFAYPPGTDLQAFKDIGAGVVENQRVVFVRSKLEQHHIDFCRERLGKKKR